MCCRAAWLRLLVLALLCAAGPAMADILFDDGGAPARGGGPGAIYYSGPRNLTYPAPNNDMMGINVSVFDWAGPSDDFSLAFGYFTSPGPPHSYVSTELMLNGDASAVAVALVTDTGGMPLVQKLGAGAVVCSGTLAFPPAGVRPLGFFYEYFSEDGVVQDEAGQWVNTSGYVGLALYDPTTPMAPPYMGWMRLETSGVGTSSSQVTIKDWAMQTIPGTPIVTGVIPEPAIAWLLLIGLGLAAGRRVVRR